MAKFIVKTYDNGGKYLAIEAEVGEELTPQEAAVWQLRDIDHTLDVIRMHLSNIENGVEALPRG